MGSKCFSVEDQQMVRMLRVGPMILTVLEFFSGLRLGLAWHFTRPQNERERGRKGAGKGKHFRNFWSESKSKDPCLNLFDNHGSLYKLVIRVPRSSQALFFFHVSSLVVPFTIMASLSRLRQPRRQAGEQSVQELHNQCIDHLPHRSPKGRQVVVRRKRLGWWKFEGANVGKLMENYYSTKNRGETCTQPTQPTFSDLMFQTDVSDSEIPKKK